MDEAKFFESFQFNIYTPARYRLTDYSKRPIPRHYFGCLVRGTAIIKSEKTELSLKPGEIFYIPKGLTYQSQWFGDEEKKIEFYSFGFGFSPTDKSFALQKIAPNAKAEELFSQLCREVPATEKGIGLLYHFFGEVCRDMKQAEKKHINPTIDLARKYMSEHTDAKISDVARHCSISQSGIYLLFKQNLNRTPNEVRLEIICDKAVELLSTTSLSVQEISDRLGFSSTSYFRKTLKAYTGKAPLEIRRESTYTFWR